MSERGSRLALAEGWSSVLLLGLAVLTVAWSVERTGWVERMPPLGQLAVVSVVVGVLFGKMRHPPVFLRHLTASYLGLFLICWRTAELLPAGTNAQRLAELLVRLNAWGYAARTGGVNSDPLAFVFFLAALTWLVGYVSAWLIFRSHAVWLGIMPSGVALLVNLSYAPRLTYWLVAYLVVVLLLAMRLHLADQIARWREANMALGPGLSRAFARDAFMVSLLVVLVAWIVPPASASPVLAEAWEQISSPWQDTQSTFGRLFASISSGSGGDSPSDFSYFSPALELRGYAALGTGTTMAVLADERRYWRAVVYDRYTSRGFLSTEGPDREVHSAEELRPPSYRERKLIQQTYRLLGPRTNHIFSAGQAVQVELPANAEVRVVQPGPVTLRPGEPAPDDLRPVERLLGDLNQRWARLGPANTAGQEASLELRRNTPPSYRFETLWYDERGIREAQFTRLQPQIVDLLGLRATVPLRRNTEYRVVSSVSTASAEQLRQAGTGYPAWALQRYTQLPDTLPPRVRQYAMDVAREARATTAYDLAVAIEARLRRIPYNLRVAPPPPGRDGVDYFLFDAVEGYCDYYASAMVVLLRTWGIPARVVSGYQAGTLDPESGAYIVREKDAHSWVEVFFPEYGWIEFEPTSSNPTIPRPESLDRSRLVPEAAPTPRSESARPERDPEPISKPRVGPGSSPSQPGFAAPGAGARSFSLPLLLTLFVPGALIVLGVILWQRHLASLSPAIRGYEQMRRIAGLLGLSARRSQTPLEYAATLAGALREAAVHAERLATAYTALLFGRKAPTPAESAALDAAWRHVKTALWRHLTRAVPWWPGRKG